MLFAFTDLHVQTPLLLYCTVSTVLYVSLDFFAASPRDSFIHRRGPAASYYGVAVVLLLIVSVEVLLAFVKLRLVYPP